MIRVTFVSQILYFSTIDLLGDNWYLCRKSWQYSFGAEPFSILKNRLLEIERRRGVISVGRLPPSAVISGKIIVPRGTISEANVILGVHLSPWKFDSWSKNWCNRHWSVNFRNILSSLKNHHFQKIRPSVWACFPDLQTDCCRSCDTSVERSTLPNPAPWPLLPLQRHLWFPPPWTFAFHWKTADWYASYQHTA